MRLLRRCIVMMGCGLAGLTFCLSSGFAQESEKPVRQSDNTPQKPPNSDADRKAVKAEISEDDKNDALRFAEEHHPELFRLLNQLRESRPAEYAKAIRDLHQQTQSIRRMKDRNAPRYESQLAAWKLDSQIRVLMARWSRTQSMELEDQIRELLARRQVLKAEHLAAEQERLKEQLQRIEDQQAALAAPIDERVNKEWKQLAGKAAAVKDSRSGKPTPPSAATGRQ